MAVLLGVERDAELGTYLSGRTVGLVTNAAATDSSLVPTVDRLRERFTIASLFGPEHGIRGDAAAGDAVASGLDERSGLPVYSLYGENRAPSADQIAELDAVVIDLPDVGARFYTYLSTVVYVMQACAAASVRCIVLDRPNPIGGEIVEGLMLDRRFSSFVGRFPVPVRHGLTIGEYAVYINETERVGCDLHVVTMTGWRRKLYADQLGLPWVMPSPNLPTVESATVYAGTCLFEGTNLSEGRGTTKPFELIGAPWLDTERVLRALRSESASRALAGVRLRECRFRPHISKHAGETCRGLQLHVTDRSLFRPYSAAVALIDSIRRTHDEFVFLEPTRGVPDAPDARFFIDLLSGDDSLRAHDFRLAEYLTRCAEDSAAFIEARSPYLLYPA
ncbi:MAG: DUF1343 domain-containing protein [Spirochaetaceae bacterium]|nr:MAG: DUF1343 domain-containing protein [Spirochaetaceae bacterium]